MFLHNFKYDFKRTVRDKGLIFWMMAFPIILSTLFQLALSNIYDEDVLRDTINIAVVGSGDSFEDQMFSQAVSAAVQDGEPLFKAEFTDSSEAENLLKEDKVSGVIHTDDMSRMFSPKVDTTHQTIIREFIDTYKTNATVYMEAMLSSDSKKAEELMSLVQNGVAPTAFKQLGAKSMNIIDQYFYNVIAMVAFFGSMTGMLAAVGNQPNLSKNAARKSVSPAPRGLTVASGILSAFAAQLLCVIISTTYILTVLGKYLGDNILLVYLSGAAGALLGVAFGFFIGSIGKMSEGGKTGITMSVTMLCCFLSGLMVPNIKAEIESSAPIINRLNPAALISDLFYCMNMYDDYTIYIQRLCIMLALTVVFGVLGILFTRRRKYASI